MNFSSPTSKSKPYLLVPIFFSLLATNTCYGFLEWESKEYTEELTAEAILFVRPFLWAAQTQSPDVFDFKTDHIAGGVLRLIGNGKLGGQFDWHVNTATVYVSDEFELPFFINNTNTSQPERSGLLTKVVNDEKQQSIFVDQVYGSYIVRDTDIIFGRQPINFANAVYFTPNDFFAPFSAQTFFRDFKSGVDAIRLEHALQNLTQLSFFYVLGYQLDDPTTGSFEDKPDSGRASKLIQMSSVIANLEWKFLGGRVIGDPVIGGAVQGELFAGLGIRAEGHHRRESSQQGGHISQWSLGFEHQFSADLGGRVEFYYNSAGISEQEDYATLFSLLTKPVGLNVSPGLSVGSKYIAAGFDYQLSPLWAMSSVLLSNTIDHSYLMALDFNYSLSNESTLNFGFSLPEGDEPSANGIESEFGIYPRSITIELRVYY